MPHQDVVLTFAGDDTPEDFKGTLRTFMSPVDQVAFQRTYGEPLGVYFSQDDDRLNIEWVLWFLWRAWNREQRAGLGFEAFVEALDDYEVVRPAPDEEGIVAPDPTTPTPEPTPSS